MRDFRVQHFSNQSGALTPKESYTNHSLSLMQNSPSIKSKSKGPKDSHNMDRPKSNKPRNHGEPSSASQRQLEVVTGTMQKLLMDRNTNNLYSSLYNSASKARDREKSGLMNMFKLRDIPKESVYSQRGSPVRRPIKNQSTIRLKEEKAMVFDAVMAKSYRKDEVESRLNDKLNCPTSRQKSNMINDRGESPNKSALNLNSMSQRYVKDNSPMKQMAKSGTNFLEGYSSNMEHISNRMYKALEFDQERHVHASSLYYSRVSPHRQEIANKPFEYVQIEGNKAYKSTRPQEMDRKKAVHGEESRDDGNSSRKLHKRGISIDQGIQFLGDKQSLILRERERSAKLAPEEKQIGLSQSEIKNVENKEQEQEQEQEAQVVVINSEQEQTKYFEKLLHIDKVTFDFEKQMVKRRFVKQNSQNTPISTTTGTKQSVHTRTRSMEEPGSLVNTKSSSRWNTKRSVGEDGHAYADETVEIMELQRGERGY